MVQYFFRPLTSAAPDGAPNITRLSSTELQQIAINWTIVDPDLQNGIITNYTVLFQLLDGNGNRNGNVRSKTVEVLSTVLTAADGIEAGVTYNISVAANTIVGRGPTSRGINQPTILEPPDLIRNGDFVEVDQNLITETTILITLPSIPGSDFSHFWVIAMKHNETLRLDVNPTVHFPNNRSFRLYSEDIPANIPYIVAEVAASKLASRNNFVLGNNSANGDFNEVAKYVNGRLTPGTEYTVFLWGFSPSVPVSIDCVYG